MNNFKELIVWQKSIDFSIKIYEITNGFPKEEIYGLSSQIRRCVVSIPSNIAEGAGRNSKKEFSHFLSIALGSSFELETQLILAQRIGYKIESLVLSEINHIQNMIYKLKQSLDT